MYIPDKIIDALETLPFDDRCQALCAIVSYMRTGVEPSEPLSPVAEAAFRLARIIIDPILRRRARKTTSTTSTTPTTSTTLQTLSDSETQKLINPTTGC